VGDACIAGPSASYAYYQATELPGDSVVAYVTGNDRAQGPYVLQLPDKTGAIDFFLVSAPRISGDVNLLPTHAAKTQLLSLSCALCALPTLQ
jgi:hypothetical protein